MNKTEYGSYVYLLYKNGEVVYVGATSNARARIGSHKSEGAKDFDAVYVLKEIRCDDNTKTKEFRLLVEATLIEHFRPKYNLTIPAGLTPQERRYARLP